MYEEMVKNAYEEILGFDKMAGIRNYDDGKLQKKIDKLNKKTEDGYAGATRAGAIKGTVSALGSAALLHGLNKATGKDNLILSAIAPTGKDIAKSVAGNSAAWVGSELLKHKFRTNRLDKLKAEQNRRQSQKAAEKAAAYYDEAQYIKEAAEADYAEACAYEDAALQILNELGYLD